MIVNVLYFGIVKERLGRGAEPLELGDGATVADLIERLDAMHGSIEAGAGSVRIAVNRDYVDSDHRLSENDEVAVIPPVAGGL